MRRTGHIATIVVTCLLAAGIAAAAERTVIVNDFETEKDLKAWDIRAGGAKLVSEGATHGAKALELTFDPKGQYNAVYINLIRTPKDWSAYDALVLDVVNPNQAPIPASLLIGDEAWQANGTYWNRHNAGRTLPPGKTAWVIPVRGLYRGEAGSRNNDIKRNIDPDKITRLDFGFGGRGGKGRVIIDNLRFVKSDRPEGVWAFDFGPPSQPVMLGWAPVSNQTVHDGQKGYGWLGGELPGGFARDTTFGPMLLRDFCEARGRRFRVDVPAGEYQVKVFYENAGYWGGEQSRHAERSISVDGGKVWQEKRPDGWATALYRFENVEPIAVDIWDTYMADELAKPATFTAKAGRSGLTLSFDADNDWSSKVAGIVLHRSDDKKAAAWVAGQLEALAEEFRSLAVPLDKPAPPMKPSAGWAKLGLVAWPVDIEDDVRPASVPGLMLPGPGELRLARLAVRGEAEPFCVAVRPLKDLGECTLKLEPFEGPGKIQAATQVVWYGTSRGFGSIAYTLQPNTLRQAASVTLPKDITRQIVVTCRVGEDAPAGEYAGALVIESPAGQTLLRIPLTLRVKAVTLDRDTDFCMGFFGLNPPAMIPPERRGEVLEETLVMLKDHGMNTVCGGPRWTLTGWKDGQPIIDFAAMDAFVALLKKHGFTNAINGYGGATFSGLHDGYVKGATGERVARESGLPYEEALMRAWKAVDAHARQAGWPVIWYPMCDETRVRERAEKELEFMKMMAKVTAAFPKTVRTSGAYSVHFRSRPESLDDMLYWHQRFFEALDINDLNNHDPSVMAEAKKLGKDIHVYNQGRSRYSFGLYQWSEFRKGVTARTQWHLNILHGYQFFDLDGREPDTSMICYGRKGIYPTIHFERCREGAEDFYLYNTLWKLAAKSEGQAAAAAKALLEDMTSRVKLNQRRPPEGFDPVAFKAKVIAAIEKLGTSQ